MKNVTIDLEFTDYLIDEETTEYMGEEYRLIVMAGQYYCGMTEDIFNSMKDVSRWIEESKEIEIVV